MNDKRRIYNGNIRLENIMLICLCIILPLAPFIIAYLIANRKPTDFINARVTAKYSDTKTMTAGYGSGIGTYYYITIGTKEFVVTDEIYKILNMGDYISAAYHDKKLFYYTYLE